MRNKIVFSSLALGVMLSSMIAMPAFAKSEDSNKLGQAKDRLEAKKEEIKKKAQRLSCVKEADIKLGRALRENQSEQNTAYKTAKETRNTSFKGANATLKTALSTAESNRKTAVNAAKSLTDAAAKEAALKAAKEAYRAALKAANSAFNASIKAAQEAYRAALKAANNGLAPANSEDRGNYKTEVEHCKAL